MPCGLCDQEAPQADGEEEAPQAAAQDARPTSQRQVASRSGAEVAMARVVLVTGVSRYLGAGCAHLLTDDPAVDRVIGVDVVPPTRDIGRPSSSVPTSATPSSARSSPRPTWTLSCTWASSPRRCRPGGALRMKEINVIGTMQLLAACQKCLIGAEARREVVDPVYGAGPRDPAMFTEDMEPRTSCPARAGQGLGRGRGVRAGFARRRPT